MTDTFTAETIDRLVGIYRDRRIAEGARVGVGEVLAAEGYLLLSCPCGDYDVAYEENEDAEFTYQHSGCAETLRLAARNWADGDPVTFTDHLGTFHTGTVVARVATIEQARSANLFETLSDVDERVHLMRRHDLESDAR